MVFFVEFVEVKMEKLQEFSLNRNMVGETKRILEDAAANHKTVDFWKFFIKFHGVSFVFYVAIDD